MRVRPMTHFDVRVVADIGKESFANDELFAWLYPYKDQYPHDSARWQLLRLRTRLVERGSRGFVSETEAGDDGWDATVGPVVVGYAFFIVKGSGEEAQKWRTESLMNKIERYLLGWEECYEQRLLQRAMDPKALEMLASLKQFSVYQALDEYWYLGFLGVDPKHQRRGIGAQLVKHGFSMAREGGLPMALEATVAGKGLYSKLGFKTIQKLRIERLSEDIVTMLWEPESLKGRWLEEEKEGIAELKVP